MSGSCEWLVVRGWLNVVQHVKYGPGLRVDDALASKHKLYHNRPQLSADADIVFQGVVQVPLEVAGAAHPAAGRECQLLAFTMACSLSDRKIGSEGVLCKTKFEFPYKNMGPTKIGWSPVGRRLYSKMFIHAAPSRG